ncbi:MAG: hypothetical protein NC191_10030 [Muribaculaceae bacterium]|nr:hypothetical protein [Muribaculaceae bacterium]
MSYMSIMGNMNFCAGLPFFGIPYGGTYYGFGMSFNSNSNLNIFQKAKLSGQSFSFSSSPSVQNTGVTNIFTNPMRNTGFNYSYNNSNNIFGSISRIGSGGKTSSGVTFGNLFGSRTVRRSTTNNTTDYSTNISSVKNIQWWKDLGYNPQRARQLMNYMRGHATGFKGNCVGVVRQAINKVYYGGATHYARFGKACNVGRDFLSKDKHFKKVAGVNLAKINPKDIPEGVIIIYGPGYSRKHPECGHGEISNGSGRGYSDGITHIKNSGRQTIKELWIPV